MKLNPRTPPLKNERFISDRSRVKPRSTYRFSGRDSLVIWVTKRGDALYCRSQKID